MADFWTGKRVCVLGGAGFLGSHLVEALLTHQAEVLVLDDFSRGQNRIDGAQYESIDLTRDDEYQLSAPLQDFKPTIVFNLAATVGGVLWNQTHQAAMFSENMALQSVPVQVCADFQIPYFIQVSSVCVYAPEYAAGALEANGQLGEPVAANNGYAWAKRMGERVALWSDLPHVCIVRPSNLYGPRDYFDERAHVIPALIKKCLNGDVIRVHGTGDEVREFLYIEDAARGLLAAAEFGQHRAVYNLGTYGRTQISISLLVSLIQELLGIHKPVEFTGGDAGDRARWSDCSKAQRDLNFSADMPLANGLARTIEWYQKELVIA